MESLNNNIKKIDLINNNNLLQEKLQNVLNNSKYGNFYRCPNPKNVTRYLINVLN